MMCEVRSREVGARAERRQNLGDASPCLVQHPEAAQSAKQRKAEVETVSQGAQHSHTLAHAHACTHASTKIVVDIIITIITMNSSSSSSSNAAKGRIMIPHVVVVVLVREKNGADQTIERRLIVNLGRTLFRHLFPASFTEIQGYILILCFCYRLTSDTQAQCPLLLLENDPRTGFPHCSVLW
eukprot:3935036-Rhodomonas_salina.3